MKNYQLDGLNYFCQLVAGKCHKRAKFVTWLVLKRGYLQGMVHKHASPCPHNFPQDSWYNCKVKRKMTLKTVTWLAIRSYSQILNSCNVWDQWEEKINKQLNNTCTLFRLFTYLVVLFRYTQTRWMSKMLKLITSLFNIQTCWWTYSSCLTFQSFLYIPFFFWWNWALTAVVRTPTNGIINSNGEDLNSETQQTNQNEEGS